MPRDTATASIDTTYDPLHRDGPAGAWTTWTLTVTRAGDPQFPARRLVPDEPQFVRPQHVRSQHVQSQHVQSQHVQSQHVQSQLTERPAPADLDTRPLLLPLVPVEGRIVSGPAAGRRGTGSEVATLTPPGGLSTRRAARDAERGAAPAPVARRTQQPRVPALLPAALALAIGIGLVTAGVRADALDRFGLSAPDNDTVVAHMRTMIDEAAPGH